MSSKCTGIGCPDDPARTADWGHFPDEQDDPETKRGAEVETAMQALTTGQGAFGLSHADLVYSLVDYVFNMDDTSLIHVLSAARNTNAVTQACEFLATQEGS